MNRNAISVAVASALVVPGVVAAQETTVQTYGRINNAGAAPIIAAALGWI